jgi:hypothetical protein
MDTLYHATTRTDWAPHSGACLCSSEQAAIESAEIHGGEVRLYQVQIDLSGLTVSDRSGECDRDSQTWPGDRAASRAALIADGVDVVTYEDECASGRALICTRLLSDAALAAVVECYEVDVG